MSTGQITVQTACRLEGNEPTPKSGGGPRSARGEGHRLEFRTVSFCRLEAGTEVAAELIVPRTPFLRCGPRIPAPQTRTPSGAVVREDRIGPIPRRSRFLGDSGKTCSSGRFSPPLPRHAFPPSPRVTPGCGDRLVGRAPPTTSPGPASYSRCSPGRSALPPACSRRLRPKPSRRSPKPGVPGGSERTRSGPCRGRAGSSR